MRVDVHSHHLPARYLAALRAGDGPAMSKPHDNETLAGMIARQDAVGIDVQVLSTGPNSPYLRDREQAVDAARIVNDAYADVVARHGSRFAAFGSVPLPHAEAAAAEAVRCIDQLGFAGIHLGASALGRPIDDPAFTDFWIELDRRDAVIFIHPGGVVVGTEPGLAGMDDTLIAVTIGSAAEMATVALRLAALSRTYRRIRPIIGLLGGALPFLLQRCLSIVGKWPLPTTLSGFTSPDAVVAALRRFHYDINLLPDPAVLASARAAYGIDRLVFGSDAPGGGSPAAAAAFLEQGGLSADEREAIMSRNVRGVLGGKIKGLAPLQG